VVFLPGKKAPVNYFNTCAIFPSGLPVMMPCWIASITT